MDNKRGMNYEKIYEIKKEETVKAEGANNVLIMTQILQIRWFL